MHSALSFSTRKRRAPRKVRTAFRRAVHSVSFTGKGSGLTCTMFGPSAVVASRLLTGMSRGRRRLAVRRMGTCQRFGRHFVTFYRHTCSGSMHLVISTRSCYFRSTVSSLASRTVHECGGGHTVMFTALRVCHRSHVPCLHHVLSSTGRGKCVTNIGFMHNTCVRTRHTETTTLKCPSPVYGSGRTASRGFSRTIHFAVSRLSYFRVFVKARGRRDGCGLTGLVSRGNLGHSSPHVFFTRLLNVDSGVSFGLTRRNCGMAGCMPCTGIQSILPCLVHHTRRGASITKRADHRLHVLGTRLSHQGTIHTF